MKVNTVDSAKYLEVVIDNELKSKQHIKMIEGMVASSIEILFKLNTCFLNTLCYNFTMH